MYTDAGRKALEIRGTCLVAMGYYTCIIASCTLYIENVSTYQHTSLVI